MLVAPVPSPGQSEEVSRSRQHAHLGRLSTVMLSSLSGLSPVLSQRLEPWGLEAVHSTGVAGKI